MVVGTVALMDGSCCSGVVMMLMLLVLLRFDGGGGQQTEKQSNESYKHVLEAVLADSIIDPAEKRLVREYRWVTPKPSAWSLAEGVRHGLVGRVVRVCLLDLTSLCCMVWTGRSTT